MGARAALIHDILGDMLTQTIKVPARVKGKKGRKKGKPQRKGSKVGK
jgi:hypothetical protein